jgi:hypothetical protein
MRLILRKNILILFIFLVFVSPKITGRENPTSILFLSNSKVVNQMPPATSNQIVVVSNRYFNTKQDSIVSKGVNPNLKMSFFIVCLKNDSVFITPFQYLKDAIGTLSKNRDFLIFVNGYGKNFGQNLYRGLELDKRYNLNVIVFDWPSDYQPVRKSAHFARKVTGNLVHLIDTFNLAHRENFNGTAATLVFHSMGNHIVRNMARNYPYTGTNRHIFNNLLLNAAGVKQWHHAKWVDKLNIQDRIYITSNKGDKTLKLLVLARLTTQLGMKAKQPQAGNANYIDFSLIAGEDHNYFIGRSNIEKEDPRVFNFFNTVFHGQKVYLDDSQVFSPKEKGKGYYIY